MVAERNREAEHGVERMRAFAYDPPVGSDLNRAMRFPASFDLTIGSRHQIPSINIKSGDHFRGLL